MNANKKKLFVFAACVAVAGGGAAAYAGSLRGDEPPVGAKVAKAPDWMIPGPDGQIDRSRAPTRIPVADIDGKPLLDESGKPVTVPDPVLMDVRPAPPGSPEATAAMARQAKLVELGLVTERLDGGALNVEFHPEHLSKAQRVLMAQGKIDQVIEEVAAAQDRASKSP